MSSEQTRRVLNQLDNDLILLEKELADLVIKESDTIKRINNTQRSITKNTSQSMLQSKLRQIDGYNNELVRISSDKADINRKSVEKRKKRIDGSLQLQREETAEMKKHEKSRKDIERYERNIGDLRSQIQNMFSPQNVKHLYIDDTKIEYDVFISHASEDKTTFTNELNEALKEKGFTVWYDTQVITWGDSLRAKIDEGLKKSHYGMGVLSKNYIKKGWTQYELDGLFQKEMTGGKTILPIWHDITKQEVQAFSPTLAGRKALNTAMYTTNEIADELKQLFRSEKNDSD